MTGPRDPADAVMPRWSAAAIPGAGNLVEAEGAGRAVVAMERLPGPAGAGSPRMARRDGGRVNAT